MNSVAKRPRRLKIGAQTEHLLDHWVATGVGILYLEVNRNCLGAQVVADQRPHENEADGHIFIYLGASSKDEREASLISALSRYKRVGSFDEASQKDE